MIGLLFIVLAINYIMMPVLFMMPDLSDWAALYVVLMPRVLWFFAVLAGGVFWYYKRMVLFWLNLVGFLCFYVPLIKYMS